MVFLIHDFGKHLNYDRHKDQYYIRASKPLYYLVIRSWKDTSRISQNKLACSIISNYMLT